MKNPHRQFPGKMDKVNKKTYKKGYKTLAKGNVPEGYKKLKHVKLFENFDSQTPEMEGAVNDAISEIFPNREMAMKAYEKDSDAFYAEILAQVKSDTGMTDEDSITDGIDNWFSANESGKWFVAQEGEERFKFQAKDIDEATEIASKTWNAKVLGEVTEEMEFEDTPMEEADKADHPFVDEDMYEVIWAILNAYDEMPDAQSKIEQFFAKYKVNNGQDTDDVVRDALKSDMTVKDARTFATEIGINLDDVDESKVNEGSYTDFLTSHGNALQKAVKQMKEIAAVYDDKIEDKADEVEKAMSTYDDNVGQQLDSWTGDSNISTDKIAKFAIDNQDKYGTEPKMVLDAIDDFYNIMK